MLLQEQLENENIYLCKLVLIQLKKKKRKKKPRLSTLCCKSL